MNDAVDLKTAIESLGLVEWTHICVRRKCENQIYYLGGGNVKSVVNRFGSMHVKKTMISDEKILLIYVE